MEIDYKEIASYVVILIIVLIAAQHLNVVVSGSMEPAFYRGDIVLVEKADFFGIHEFNASDVKVGDVVVYDAAWYNQPVIHRIINITDINGTTMYVIKGDNNNAPDPYYVTSSQIKEKVVTVDDNLVVIPKIGYLSLWLRGL
ncbi:archaean signal peptidase. Serine peptidase. MEROPS family S26B [Methanobrevibacter gottschalkii]|uniref:Signal peptidase I n=2 Tax=Methanobrevibacter gottschalkii TaxID=190974 RepID=A0A3N5B648_9EURY|nr:MULTISPECIES: signal peptidase I [Methanobrevibacter]MCQ2970653.1 signal peptidase I [archaeon]OEC93716.1 signal peptidase I [Methanobrevibacter sp. A27]RPF52823.1 signal peptidase [Methanobrevibacter gottschalkii DSM 11977]SEK20325.1 archaean signal peptidase. Serine peptidase. MEROPS family S26B [Methanobrevibacter gottschalkii]